MKNTFAKFMNLFGAEDAVSTEQPQQTKTTPTYESNVRKDETVETIVCNCCCTNEIQKIKTNMYTKQQDGTEVSLYTEPKETYKNGREYDTVAICDECLSKCQNQLDEQCAWLLGKANKISLEIQEKQNAIESNIAMAQEIQTDAENRIQVLAEENNNLNIEINDLNMMIQQLAQEHANVQAMYQQ